ncbi:hypothetical protein R1flu_014532 [Riccia fluitans]|uniref:Uncharacterized protein n=1 Tax=Riccia fluitans TaxID=41844 RepID=A0ABD1YGD0_9MARC
MDLALSILPNEMWASEEQVHGKPKNWGKEQWQQVLAYAAGDAEGLKLGADSNKKADYYHLFTTSKMGLNGYPMDCYRDPFKGHVIMFLMALWKPS